MIAETASRNTRQQPWRVAVLIGLQCVGVLVIALLTLPTVSGWHGADMNVYANAAQRLLDGQLPYRDFALEYPPLALVPFVLPRFLVFGRTLAPDNYWTLFLLMNVALSALTALATARSALVLYGRNAVPRVLAWYTLLALILAPLLPWRYDMFPALLTALALLAVLRDRPGWAGVCVGLGIAAKLYPAVCLPVFVTYYLARRTFRAALLLVVATIGTVVATLLPFLLTDATSWLSFLQYHQLRGLQIESVAGGLLCLEHVLGLTRVEIAFGFGSLQIIAGAADSAVRALPYILLIVSALVYIAFVQGLLRPRDPPHGSPEQLVVYAATLFLLVFIVANKVLSPQYLVWFLPFVPLLPARQVIAWAVVAVITIFNFPFYYEHLLALEPLPVVLLNIRNLIMTVMLPWLVLMLGQHARRNAA